MLKKLLSMGRLGHIKEQQAKRWLEEQGMQIIAQNYRCKGGEIDLIGLLDASHPATQRLFFFEVKYRTQLQFGHPAEFVTPQKQRRIIHCAQLFLLKHPQYVDCAMQFDVLTFIDQQQQPTWLENAFDLS